MQVITKKQAMSMIVDSLFVKSDKGTLKKAKFSGGKYAYNGSVKPYIGRDVPDIRGVKAVYPERRTDKEGAYVQLMCICE